MIIRIVEDKISLSDLREIAKEYYIDMVKGVVDISMGKVAFGGEYHMDANVKILEEGSTQTNVWGFNLYVNQPAGNRIEFTSLINIRPHVGNKSMEVQDEEIRARMQDIIERKIS